MAGPESKTDSQSCIGGLFIHNAYIYLILVLNSFLSRECLQMFTYLG